MTDRVRRVQELRRSNAAQPRPGKRYAGPSADEWKCSCDPQLDGGRPDPLCGVHGGRCGLCGEECVTCARGECDLELCTCPCA
jgi:hypothetical protein